MMQHTEKHQFNLIETSDTFSPAALNENMEKLEAALDTKIGPADLDVLERRVTTLELHKAAAGYYVGDGTTFDDYQFIDLGFTPAIVITDLPNLSQTKATLCVPGYPNTSIEIVPGGFKVRASSVVSSNPSYNTLNQKGKIYRYLALC